VICIGGARKISRFSLQIRKELLKWSCIIYLTHSSFCCVTYNVITIITKFVNRFHDKHLWDVKKKLMNFFFLQDLLCIVLMSLTSGVLLDMASLFDLQSHLRWFQFIQLNLSYWKIFCQFYSSVYKMLILKIIRLIVFYKYNKNTCTNLSGPNDEWLFQIHGSQMSAVRWE